MEELEAWLRSGRDFEAGRLLYNKYAPRYRPNRVFSLQINSSRNSLSEDLLEKELSEIYKVIKKAKRPAPKSSAKYHTRGEQSDLPPDLRALDDQIPKLYKNRDYYRYQARETEPGALLKDLAIKALKCDLRIREIYKILDYYKRTGLYPPGYFPDDTQDQEKIAQLTFWLKAQRTYPKWIQRNKNNPEKAAEVKERQKVMDKINEYLKYADQ